ncbi:MAG: hypothetical protein US58_C0001G0020 [Candidatus Magasanikbacteria bacterium GW2011_GWA2_37_8]|uniref:Uncharacterized protein n=1 Tax=Candidatus Magasanikbacteria bacterium GW2011_GWA2_37_8 TaxID=1619036 RepID=A0A0G0KL87_9BACT|nr:MAG: hypothetical protein US58_C0001G0020 [Candidatus Magasanikbacteria bacterium GW2011_GWA2_37_8]
MWAVANFELFLYDHREMIGDAAPHILMRAIRASKSIGLISTDKSVLFDIMSGNMMLCGMFLTDFETEHHQAVQNLAIDGQIERFGDKGSRDMALEDIAGTIHILFGQTVPYVFDPFLEGQNTDGAALNTLIREELAKRGVEWPTDVNIFRVG